MATGHPPIFPKSCCCVFHHHLTTCGCNFLRSRAYLRRLKSDAQSPSKSLQTSDSGARCLGNVYFSFSSPFNLLSLSFLVHSSAEALRSARVRVLLGARASPKNEPSSKRILLSRRKRLRGLRCHHIHRPVTNACTPFTLPSRPAPPLVPSFRRGRREERCVTEFSPCIADASPRRRAARPHTPAAYADRSHPHDLPHACAPAAKKTAMLTSHHRCCRRRRRHPSCCPLAGRSWRSHR